MEPSKLWSLVWSKILAVKIRVKIMGIALGLVLLLGLSVILLVRSSFRATLIDQSVERGTAIAHELAARSANLIDAGDIPALRRLVDETATNSDDVDYVFVLDRSRDILVHTFEGGLPIDLLTVNTDWQHGLRSSVEVLDIGEEVIFDITLPIWDEGTAVVHIGLSDRELDGTVAAITNYLLVVTGVASLLGVLAAYVLTAVLTRPILDLVEATEAIGREDFQRRAPVWANDEIGQLSIAFNAMIESISRSREKLQHEEWMRSQLLEKVITVQEEERKRIARELHDQTSQSLTSLMVGLKTVEMAETLKEVQERIAELRLLTGETLDEVHTLALGLRPSSLDDLGLLVAIERYAGDFSRQFGINVDYQSTGFEEGQRLPSRFEMPLYRIVQEALNNAVKHAEPANVSILVESRGTAILVIVEDDGKGFDVAEVMDSRMEMKLGLFGMQERASLIGGALTIESNPGTGTTVFVEVPTSGEG